MLVTGYAEFGEEKTLWEKGRIGLCPSEALSATIASQIILIASPAPVQHGWGFCLMRDLFFALSSLKLRVYTEDLGKQIEACSEEQWILTLHRSTHYLWRTKRMT